MSAGTERRRHVRLKPSADVPARVALVGDGLMREMIDVVDISVGGMALTAVVLSGAVGVEVVDAPPRAAQAISRYVAELLERGGSA